MKTAFLFLLGVTCFGCRLGDEILPTAEIETIEPARPGTDSIRDALDRAHHAYGAGDHRKMIEELGTVLADPEADDAARANAIELVDAALVDSKGKLDSGFELPAGITWMRLLFQQADRDGTPAYLAMLNGGLEPGVEIDEIRFVRERDGKVLASRKSQLGYFESGKEKDQPFFYIHTTDARSPMGAGAYRIEWTFADGRSGSSRVVVPTLKLADLPRIIEPARGDASGDQPTIRWQPPSWITEKPFGRVLVEVRRESYAPRVGQRWATWSEDSELTQIKVGDGGEPPGAHLDAGESYSAAVQYQWRIQYGDLQLGSVARAQREITVGSR
ncbi:MAG: hypothetical protein HOV80_23950 [Polyangiaceae bacterium]|nr:hypothetical protein [Polyangiaceae bacterium]